MLWAAGSVDEKKRAVPYYSFCFISVASKRTVFSGRVRSRLYHQSAGPQQNLLPSPANGTETHSEVERKRSVAELTPDSTVLITGETGTGKELIARAVHKGSQRAGHAFIAVNRASIPSSLIASELFGHEKGAFTGALQRRQGRFELAQLGCGGYNSLRNLVGLPGFEPGTSCTPNTRPASTGYTASGVFYGLHGFGASASAHRRSRWIEFLAHFWTQYDGCCTPARPPTREAGFGVR